MQTEIEKIAKAVPDTDIRICRRIEVGRAVQQGDVYLHRVADNHPRGKELGTRQVALGTTVGARHVAEGKVAVYEGKQLPEWVTEPDWLEPGALLGPVVVGLETWPLTHPEHPHHRLPAGTYQVTYQADYATRKRVVD